MPTAKENLIVALDTPELEQAIKWSKQLSGKVAAVKLGLEFFVANGPEAIAAIKDQGVEIFLDLKFHDIPNTTKEAVKQSLNLGVKFLTIHISGGREMLEWSANLAKDSNAMILGVSILTSMNQPQFNELGFLGEIKDQVLKFAKLAEDSGLQGMVCSPLEVKLLKENGLKLKLITPGIRFDSDDKGDQKRIMTPKMALISGSDYLVMGRSITKAGSSILERVEYFDSSLVS
ncbi:MAG: orotidine-5'-phosphate decarboxylase [Alphaproteobacteria bacterium]|jgi:orotidine-5'-phosphate decarboxylase|nr:orotidine-5'-phosphate decarboxylase [Alphaproteobacteria bacterium]MBT5827573.1 orotidine-5'-phosphate decarboxylase [Alphaproteobacteria bacterium]